MRTLVPILAIVGGVVVVLWLWNSWGPGANAG